MMYHKEYMREFAKQKEVHDFVDNLDPSRSDDLAFQMMVYSLTNKDSIVVDSEYEVQELDDNGAVSSHTGRTKWRSKAIKWLMRYYNIERFPMKYTILRLRYIHYLLALYIILLIIYNLY